MVNREPLQHVAPMTASPLPPMTRPRLALTCGDPAGIGPEVAVAAAHDRRVREVCEPVLFGSLAAIEEAARRLKLKVTCDLVPVEGEAVPLGTPSAAAGQIAYDSLQQALGQCLQSQRGAPPEGDHHASSQPQASTQTQAGSRKVEPESGRIEGLVTAPLNKFSLSLAGVPFPGHTEILGQHAVDAGRFAMMLHVPPGDDSPVAGPHGLSIVHVTLHTSVASVPKLLTRAAVVDGIRLLARDLPRLGCREPRIAVASLNPHGGEGGLFGDEEERTIAPAVAQANQQRLTRVAVAGPLPCDTLIRRAVQGEFDAVVAMYHDQGHIPVKLIAFDQAINITLGLPIVRTSPTHGTAFDLVGRGRANAAGMIGAVRTAAAMVAADAARDPSSFEQQEATA